MSQRPESPEPAQPSLDLRLERRLSWLLLALCVLIGLLLAALELQKERGLLQEAAVADSAGRQGR